MKFLTEYDELYNTYVECDPDIAEELVKQTSLNTTKRTWYNQRVSQ